MDWYLLPITLLLLGGYCGQIDSEALERVAVVTSRRVQKGSDVFLQCRLGSNTAIVRWEISGGEIPSGGRTRYWREGSLLVVKDAQVDDSGTYSCRAQENGVSYAVASYNVSVMDSSTASSPSVPERLMSKGQEFIYLILIAVLGAFTLVLSTLSVYLCCSPTKRGNYNMRLPRASLVELQNVSGTCTGKAEEGEAGHYAGERFLKIIPGEGATTGNQAAELLPPPPPPPPLPLAPDPAGATPNGLPGLPHVLRKMNGNSYVLLRQASEMEATSPHYHSFTEELSKMLEKRKHAQLVEKLDESSV